ncbi:hypothetical protein GSI_10012 [Ganoderma sinense ZZ0214-1]|uniref:Uncharacterized protein n=1 Tax=Ganoderma sinense ZZ0214-1 TaxID=1077348 RepID=A0A2G8S290_9APHY|nr:hypothetical protein GSI_10012 [Ganoderma sinense ZZ0214-1]
MATAPFLARIFMFPAYDMGKGARRSRSSPSFRTTWNDGSPLSLSDFSPSHYPVHPLTPERRP